MSINYKFGLLDMLTVTFITLKLTNTISWSWLWVLAPTLFPISIGIILFILLLIVRGIRA